MAFTETLMTDADVVAYDPHIHHEKSVQSARYFPISTVFTSEITWGRAILAAIHADASLHAELGGRTQREILDAIVSLALASPGSAGEIRAYSGAAAHVRPFATTELNYLPAVRLWKLWMSGSTEITDVFVALP